MMHVRLLALAPLVAVAMTPACSSSSPAPPQAGVSVNLQQGPLCAVGTQGFFSVGGSGLAPAANGSNQGSETVNVACTVAGSASSGYDVNLDVVLSGTGSLAISGHVSGDTSSSQPNIQTHVVISGGLGDWKESDCTISYNASDRGVAPGRIWAHLDCTNLVDGSKGGQSSCHGVADFRFENCGQ